MLGVLCYFCPGVEEVDILLWDIAQGTMTTGDPIVVTDQATTIITVTLGTTANIIINSTESMGLLGAQSTDQLMVSVDQDQKTDLEPGQLDKDRAKNSFHSKLSFYSIPYAFAQSPPVVVR